MIHVLLVDDNGEVRRSLKVVLADLFPATMIEEAESAAQAMALVESSAFDVVVLDLSLPDRSGMVTLRDLRRLHPTLPVVVMSFHPEAGFMAAAQDAGAAAYVTKGSPAAVIRKAVRVAVGDDADRR